MDGGLRRRGSVDSAALVRHGALCLATVTVWSLRGRLGADDTWLAVIAATALLNVGLALLGAPDKRLARCRLLLSPVFGLLGWTALLLLGPGLHSPFVAGLWLEIVLSGLALSERGTLAVTLATLAAIWSAHGFATGRDPLASVALHSVFLLAIGGVTVLVTRRSIHTERELLLGQSVLRDRLRDLEREIDDLRTAGRLGENLARLIHAFKNAVHALRGFTQLIETRLSESARDREALEGLRATIDRLEEIARLTLEPVPAETSRTSAGACDVRRAIDEALREVAAAHPGIRWSVTCDRDLPVVDVSPALLRDALIGLALNAVQSMGGRGEVLVGAFSEGGELRIQVQDRGVGLSAQALEHLFEPGFTTKSEGSGLGLFLTRRLVESRGGALTASARSGGGARFAISLPLRGG